MVAPNEFAGVVSVRAMGVGRHGFSDAKWCRAFFLCSVFALFASCIAFDGLYNFATIGTSIPRVLCPLVSVGYSFLFGATLLLRFYVPFRFRARLGILGCTFFSVAIGRILSFFLWWTEGLILGVGDVYAQGLKYFGPHGFSFFPLFLTWYLTLSKRTWISRLLISLFTLLSLWCLGALSLRLSPSPNAYVNLVAIQPGRHIFSIPANPKSRLLEMDRLTKEALEKPSKSQETILVWPENAINGLTPETDPYRVYLSNVAKKYQVSVLYNAVVPPPEQKSGKSEANKFSPTLILLCPRKERSSLVTIKDT